MGVNVLLFSYIASRNVAQPWPTDVMGPICTVIVLQVVLSIVGGQVTHIYRDHRLHTSISRHVENSVKLECVWPNLASFVLTVLVQWCTILLFLCSPSKIDKYCLVFILEKNISDKVDVYMFIHTDLPYSASLIANVGEITSSIPCNT